MSAHRLSSPPRADAVSRLRVGDQVYLSGRIYCSAGIPTYQRLIDRVDDLEDGPPADLSGTALFHLGSSVRERDGVLCVDYVNPTTSTRFNHLMPDVIRAYRPSLVGGKGGLDDAGAAALASVGGAYLSFMGGAAHPLTAAVTGVFAIHWPELITHYRLVGLEVRELGPLTVGIDSEGESVFRNLAARAQARLPEILAELGADNDPGSAR